MCQLENNNKWEKDLIEAARDYRTAREKLDSLLKEIETRNPKVKTGIFKGLPGAFTPEQHEKICALLERVKGVEEVLLAKAR